MIRVHCEGGCGEYSLSYKQLSDLPHFKEGQIPALK